MICQRCHRRLLEVVKATPTGNTRLLPRNSHPRHSAYASTAAAPYSGGNDCSAQARRVGVGNTQDWHLRMWKRPEVALSYLDDPLKLAEHTKFLLEKGEQAKALDVVRLASKRGPCTVSWNHIINHAMGKKQARSAIDYYNEMKKRGQKPDAFTYTIVLRGLSRNVEQMPTAAERAQSIFHSMLAPNCTVRPSTIHVNAAIEVCARARNLEALYGITARLPEEGPGSADNRTYTIILNGLHDVATSKNKVEENADEDAEAPKIATSTAEIISQGKRIWADVLARWTAGSLEMDEHLACSMGRLLLTGYSKDVDDVLSLMQQTSMLPRQIPAIGQPERPKNLPGNRNLVEVANDSSERAGIYDLETYAEDHVARQDRDASQNLFKPLPQDSVVRSYAVPRHQTLSVLLAACIQFRALKAAQNYWALITSQTVPDQDNLRNYMRLLRLTHSSSLAVELLRQMYSPKSQDGFGLQPDHTTFLIAMGACRRDVNNHKSLQHATVILSQMSKILEPPSVQAAIMGAKLLGGKNGKWPIEDVSEALEALEANCLLIKSHFSYHSGKRLDNFDDFRAKTLFFVKEYSEIIRRVLGKYKEEMDPQRIVTLSKRADGHAQAYERWTRTRSATIASPALRRLSGTNQANDF